MTAATNLSVSLAEVLAYRHPGVVRRYAQEQQVSRERAEEVFQETLKWLYLCASGADAGLSCVMTPELTQLDEMWHTFLVFTGPYADFCERNFGFFLHHVPNEDEEEQVGDKTEVDFATLLEAQFGLTYDVLGKETLRRWYEEERYAA